LCLEVDELEAAVLGVSEEAQKRVRTKSLAGKPVELDEAKRRLSTASVSTPPRRWRS
jgi:hypothetical protein